jgi:DNA invertase Pin-like site-specific DNA recombinase
MKVIVAGRLSRKAEDRDQTGFDSQEREAVRWAEGNGHEVVAVVADYKSGRAGLTSRPNLRPWVTDQVGEYDGIVVLKLDRLTRGDSAETAELEAWARDNGKAIMTSEGLVFPCEGADGIRWDLAKRLAHDEWLRISERYTRMQRTLRAAGSVVGRPPWGYRIERRGGVKVLAPTADGRTYIPLIFQAVIDGKSARQVCAWLDSEGIKTMSGKPWNEGYLSTRVIKNPTYYGQRPNAGTLETEALVSFSAWQQANETLTGRARPGRGTVVRDKVFLSPVCGNPDCDATGEHPSPMYRIYNGTSKDRQPHYRCTGRGPQRKGCGLLVPVAEFDAIVTEAMLSDHANKHYDRVFVPGDDRSDTIGKLREQAMDAYRNRDMALFAELDAKANELAAMESIRPEWKETDSGMTRGEYFAKLDSAGRREYMAAFYVSASRRDDRTVGAYIAPREWPRDINRAGGVF